MDEEELQKWETVMLATYQNDKSLIDAAQNEIFGLLQQQSFDVFIEILQNSCEPLARKAASTYFCRDVEMHLKEITLNKRKKICNFILGNIMIPNQDIVIIQNYIEIIRLFASSSHKLLPEIEQFIVEIQNDPNIIRLNLLVKVIPFLKPDYVEQRYQMFSNIACNFLQLDNWDIINISISLTKVLLSCSKDIRGYENAFVRLCQLCPIVINEPVNIQNNYWNRLGELIQIGVCPPDLILAILTSISNDSISPDSALSALTAIQPSIRVLQLEQVLGVINISIINAVKFTETEGLPPDDFIGPIVEAFTYFPHQPIYQFIKTKINEILTTKGINAAAITLFSPILSESFEQLSDDMLFLRDLLKSGLQTNDSLIVQSCCSLLAEFEETHQFSSFINEIMIYIYPYLIVEDKDVRHQAFRCVQAILFDQYIQGSLEAIWSIKDQIKQEDQWSYMDILGLSINNEAEINDQQISAILEFALTFIRQPTHIMLKSYSLYILAKLIVFPAERSL
ncbi:hypothetical protein GPJ56_008747 [Histomonas meleagridis]|nr:hypothetical protein GPJ56_008747 [Histomonas meleagridis]